jgi:hypothetical protein
MVRLRTKGNGVCFCLWLRCHSDVHDFVICSLDTRYYICQLLPIEERVVFIWVRGSVSRETMWRVMNDMNIPAHPSSLAATNRSALISFRKHISSRLSLSLSLKFSPSHLAAEVKCSERSQASYRHLYDCVFSVWYLVCKLTPLWR